MENEPEKKIGRPSIYSQQLADTICDRIAEGESLRKICKDEDMPDRRTIRRWLASNESFRLQYAISKEEMAEGYFEEIVDIADFGKNDTYEDDEGNARTDYDVIQRSRLRVDARKWVVSKMLPKKYGDKTIVEMPETDLGAKIREQIRQAAELTGNDTKVD